ncbi:unnamed protein product [Hermetia illucens]|uniref:Uncharacterized protein n=1 Tax=Hermetia illucens TaxID=343691 RepID=A0A7R8YLK1_HERIL|nr:unnamed protein product [Hermetia illucens]
MAVKFSVIFVAVCIACIGLSEALTVPKPPPRPDVKPAVYRIPGTWRKPVPTYRFRRDVPDQPLYATEANEEFYLPIEDVEYQRPIPGLY